MARFDPGPLGEISGKIGNYVFRKVNGKYFVSIRPDHYKISQTKKAKNSRTGFGACVKLAKIINQHPDLQLTWKSAPIKGGSVHHRILKHNLPLAKKGRLTELNIITPEGFDNPVENVRLTTSSLQFKINNQYTFNDNISSVYKLFYVIYCYNQSDADKPSQEFISGSAVISGRDKTEVNIYFKSVEQQIIREYPDFIVYTAMLYYSVNDEITWSSSSAFKPDLLDLSL